MTDLNPLGAFHRDQGELQRPRYFPGQFLTAEDLRQDQEYFLRLLREHNRLLHGWGTVCGLEVVAAAESRPRGVRIGPGYALDPFGNEIFVAAPVELDLACCGPGAATDPCDPKRLPPGAAAVGRRLWVAIRYAECLVRPVRALPEGCACDDEVCEHSRIRDSFLLECLDQLPPPDRPCDEPSLCDFSAGRLAECPPLPCDPWVVLARVTLPASPSTEIEDGAIDNFTHRRQLFSTAVLQEQLIECCCDERPPPNLVADLELEKLSAANALQGTVEYTIRVTNLGPSQAQGIVVEDLVEVDVELQPQVSDPHSTHGGAWETVGQSPSSLELRADIPSLSPGDTAVLGFRIFVPNPSSLPIEVVNTATVSSATPDPDLSNNQAETTDTLGFENIP